MENSGRDPAPAKNTSFKLRLEQEVRNGDEN